MGKKIFDGRHYKINKYGAMEKIAPKKLNEVLSRSVGTKESFSSLKDLFGEVKKRLHRMSGALK